VVEKMAATRKTGKESGEPGILQSEWLDRLSTLLKLVRSWAEELDWSTRQIKKAMQDSRLGNYEAPALIMQKGATRLFLDPIARFAPGADGVVDLYLMPAYDDIASLYFVNGEWRLHYMSPGTPSVATIREAESSPLSKDTFAQVLDEMTNNASEPL
jgi:hypothetical protein